jgi:hypothetical protein
MIFFMFSVIVYYNFHSQTKLNERIRELILKEKQLLKERKEGKKLEEKFQITSKQLKEDFSKLKQKLMEKMNKRKSLEEGITLYGTQLDFFLPNFITPTKEKKCVYTMTSQLSLPRLDRISLQLKHWHDCISVSLHINIKDFENKFKNSLLELKLYIQKDFPEIYENVDIHLHISEYYKINTLRNFALLHCKTDLVFILDIDWIISPNIHQILNQFGPPPSKSVYCLMTLKWNCVDTHNETCFYPHGQHLSNYNQWKTTSSTFKIPIYFPYEPYAIGRRSELPLFSTRFDFGGNDKVSFFYEASLMDIGGIVLPNCSVTHYPHKNVEYWGTRSYERAVEQWHEFIIELRKKFPHKNIVNHYDPKK